MAQPIPLNLPARDPRAELQARLQNAPQQSPLALHGLPSVLQPEVLSGVQLPF